MPHLQQARAGAVSQRIMTTLDDAHMPRPAPLPSCGNSRIHHPASCTVDSSQREASEQKVIRANLDDKLADVKRVASGIKAQIATLSAYRKSLIHECVTGQRRITEADVTLARRGEAESMRSCQ